MNKLTYYKSEKGVYLKIAQHTTGSSYVRPLGNFKVNGLTTETTHSKDWYFVPTTEEPLKVTQKESDTSVATHWNLKNTELASDKIPLSISLEGAQEYYDEDDYCWYINNPTYKDIGSLYEKVYEKSVGAWLPLEVEYNFLGTVEDSSVDDPTKYKVVYNKTSPHSNNEVNQALSSIVSYEDIDRVLTPELLLHNKPCKLTSKQSYKIIRSYILDNIDGKYARITSNYDFCFTVKKVFTKTPATRQVEVLKGNGRPYTKARYRSVNNQVEEQVFEMTSSEDNYRGYTPIVGFSGDSLAELSETITRYLEELINFINEPLKCCPSCEGKGHVEENFKGVE